ncbi:MAG: M15 family metallopeptidase [Verrucomicrobiota bacterium]|jgi:D-alanyl-D-alanine carboxypeptidase
MAESRVHRLHRALGIPADYAKTHPLPAHREARRLVGAGRAPDDGKRVRLIPRAAKAWGRMRDTAAADGIILLPLSGFRSINRQATIIRRKLRAGLTLADILRFVAAPGHSEHHSGRAIDIGSPEHVTLDADFARTAAYRWLRRHAGKFGFVLSYPKNGALGIGYEPWHWCWHAPTQGR